MTSYVTPALRNRTAGILSVTLSLPRFQMLQRKRAKESRDDMDGDNTEKQESTLSMDAVRCSTEEDDPISYSHSVSFQMPSNGASSAESGQACEYEALSNKAAHF